MVCEAGADKDKAQPPLLIASVNGHLKVVRMLCEAGADEDRCARTASSC